MTDPQIVLFLDPGNTTGWSMLQYTTEGYDFQAGQAEGSVIVGDFVARLARAYGPGLHLGWEQYIVVNGGGRGGDANQALETIGIARWLCVEYHCTLLRPMPASSRVVASVALLKELGWYTPGRVHANDATRHLVAWLLRERNNRKSRR